MRLIPKSEQYEFDAKFYIISLVGIAIVASSFWYAKKLIDRAHGREVQALMTRANLDTPQEARRRAKNYIVAMVAHHRLDKKEAAKLEDIYAEAFEHWGKMWIDGRLNGEDSAVTRGKMSKMFSDYGERAQAYLASIGKGDIAPGIPTPATAK